MTIKANTCPYCGAYYGLNSAPCCDALRVHTRLVSECAREPLYEDDEPLPGATAGDIIALFAPRRPRHNV